MYKTNKTKKKIEQFKKCDRYTYQKNYLEVRRKRELSQ